MKLQKSLQTRSRLMHIRDICLLQQLGIMLHATLIQVVYCGIALFSYSLFLCNSIMYSNYGDAITNVNFLILYVDEEVDKGEARIKGFMIIGTQEMTVRTFDLCSGLSVSNLSCPLYPGNYMIVS